MVALVYAVLMLAGTLAFARSPARRALAPCLALALGAVVAWGYIQRVDADKSSWAAAAEAQERLLAMVERELPNPPPAATIYTFDHARFAAAGVPAFAVSWDLNGAVKVALDDPGLSGYPLGPSVQLVCERTSMYPSGQAYSRAEAAPYGRAYMLDASSGKLSAIGSQARCRAAAAARERKL